MRLLRGPGPRPPLPALCTTDLGLRQCAAYLQSLEPLVVAVHQPGPLWGTGACGQPHPQQGRPHPPALAPGSQSSPTTQHGGSKRPLANCPHPSQVPWRPPWASLPSSFLFASANPNWGSDSRTLQRGGENTVTEPQNLSPGLWGGGGASSFQTQRVVFSRCHMVATSLDFHLGAPQPQVHTARSAGVALGKGRGLPCPLRGCLYPQSPKQQRVHQDLRPLTHRVGQAGLGVGLLTGRAPAARSR